MPRYPQRIWLAALLVAWAVDFLFWGKPAGISFLIFIILALVAGFTLARIEQVKLASLSWVLGIGVVLLASGTLLRSEPFTRLLNGFLAIAGLALLARTFRSGGWVRFRVLSYLVLWIDLMVAMFSRAAGLPLAPGKDSKKSSFSSSLRRLLPVVRGVLLAFPVVILLAGLLSAADLVFADQMNSFLDLFNLNRLPEYVLRCFLILMMAYFLAGIYLQAILPRGWIVHLPGDEKKPEAGKPAQPAIIGKLASSEEANATDVGRVARVAEVSENAAGPQASSPGPGAPHQPPGSRGMGFLGAIEAFVILGSVNLLFLFFVAIQFRYLFGGQTNITTAGYTFSEYARRGFFELVSVAVISLVLYLSLNAITRRSSAGQERAFTVLSALLVGLVVVILVSAFQRLLLYENAYGFTRLRLYTHIFIPWLGLLLLGTITLQVLRREHYFGSLLLLTMFGFSLTFGVLNVDGMIARLNIERARTGELDGAYLLSLSDDVLPELVRAYNQPGLHVGAHDTLGAVLSCRMFWISQEEAQSWQSYHPGTAAARQALLAVDLTDYAIHQGDRDVYVELNPGPFSCYQASFID